MALDLSSSLNGALDDGFSAAIKAPKPKEEPVEAPVQLAGDIPTGEPKAPAAPSVSQSIIDLGEKKIAEEQKNVALAEAKRAAAKGETAAKEAREAAVYAEYKPRLTAPYETFKPTGDTASGLASLGLMIGMLGAMGGKKGLTSATGAMNAIAGMMTGYQEGSKEKYERERKTFEDNVKIVQQNHALVEKEFERAVKYAKYDLTGATNAMIKSSLARGDTTTANSIETRGLMKTASEVSDAGRKINGQVSTYLKQQEKEAQEAKYERMRAESRVEAGKIDTGKGAKNYLVNGKIELLTEPEALARRAFGADVTLSGTGTSRASSRFAPPLQDDKLEKLAHEIANYSTDLKALQTLSVSPEDKNKIYQRVVALHEDAGSVFNQSDFGNRSKAYGNWTNPNGTGAKQISAVATLAQHLDLLDQLAVAENNGDYPSINRLVNYLKNAAGYEEIVDFKTARQAVAGETARVLTQTGGGVSDRTEAGKSYSENASPSQIKGPIGVTKKLVAGRLEAARAQFMAGTGRTSDEFNNILPANIRETYGEYAPFLRGDKSTTAPKGVSAPTYTDQNIINDDLKKKGHKAGDRVNVIFNGKPEVWEIE
jgi:hypothetical protein